MMRHKLAGHNRVAPATMIGGLIKTGRLRLNLSQTELAKQVGMSQEAISNIEAGNRKYLSGRDLKLLAKSLQHDPKDLRKHIPEYIGEPKNEFGKFLKSRREELDLTLEDFAIKAGITYGQALSLELGSRNIYYDLVDPFARALKVQSRILIKFVKTRLKKTKSGPGRLIRTQRMLLHMSIAALARGVNVTRQFVSRVELGQCPIGKEGTLNRFAVALKLNVSELRAAREKERLKCKRHKDPLGKFVTQQRLTRHLTQTELSQQSGVSLGTLCRLERGNGHPSQSLLNKLTEALSCQVPAELIAS